MQSNIDARIAAYWTQAAQQQIEHQFVPRSMWGKVYDTSTLFSRGYETSYLKNLYAPAAAGSTFRAVPVSVQVVSFMPAPFDHTFGTVQQLVMKVSYDEDYLRDFWGIVANYESNLKSIIRREFAEASKHCLEIRDLRFGEGSFHFCLWWAVVKAWITAHNALLGGLGAILGFYPPIKAMVNDLKQPVGTIIKNLKAAISGVISAVVAFFGKPHPKPHPKPGSP